MSINPTTPITGATVPSFTTPTYTIVTDTSPAANAKQYAVTALGGTQTGVEAHSVSFPFTMTVSRPLVLKSLPAVNPITGALPVNIPNNKYTVLVRKGVRCNSTTNRIATLRLEVVVPAGSDTYEPEEIKAAVSSMIGLLNQQSSGIAQLCLDGLL